MVNADSNRAGIQSNEQRIIIIIIIISRIRGNVTNRAELRKLPSYFFFFFLFPSLMLLAWVSIALHCNRRRKAYTYFYLIGIFKQRDYFCVVGNVSSSRVSRSVISLFFFFKFSDVAFISSRKRKSAYYEREVAG